MTDVAVLLGEARSRWESAMRAAVATLEGSTRVAAEYHFGWVDVDGEPVPGGAGKALRPALALLVADALGAAPEAAVPAAVAVELIHDFSLVHDDLIDRDATRRHRPTVWAQWDDTTAVLVGDAMQTLAFEVLASTEERAPAAIRALAGATKDLIRGQADDVAFERRGEVSLGEVFGMAQDKTGALLAVSASLGALLAGGDDATVEAFHSYGNDLGIAFQLIDDLLGIWGAPEETGKPVHADLIAGKKSLPVVWTLRHGDSADAALVRSFYADHASRTEVDPDELERVAAALDDAGARRWTLDSARKHAAQALDALSAIDWSGSDGGASVETFRALADFVVDRTA